jgi:hypothetical protein
MFIHIVAWKYKTETDHEMREIHRTRLRALSDLVSGIIEFEIGADILSLDRSYDTGLIAKFESQASFDAYNVHQKHQAVVQLGREVAAHVVSVDFESTEKQ